MLALLISWSALYYMIECPCGELIILWLVGKSCCNKNKLSMICLEIFSVRVKEIPNLCMPWELQYWLGQVIAKHNVMQIRTFQIVSICSTSTVFLQINVWGSGRLYSGVCHVSHIGCPVTSYCCQKDGWVRLLYLAKEINGWWLEAMLL